MAHLQLGRLPSRSRFAEAIRFALSRSTALMRFLDDGRIVLKTNLVERAIRPVALGRNNACVPAATAVRIDGRSLRR